MRKTGLNYAFILRVQFKNKFWLILESQTHFEFYQNKKTKMRVMKSKRIYYLCQA